MRRIAIMFPLILILFFLFLNPSEADAKVYKYKDKKGVVTFTNNIESVPESLRNQVEIIEGANDPGKPGDGEREKKGPAAPTGSSGKEGGPSAASAGVSPSIWGSPFGRNSLMIIIVILLLWCLKLWVKNMILKFIARIAIKVAFFGLLYVVVYYLFVSPDENPIASTVKKTVKEAATSAREISPLRKATENVEKFNKTQKERQEALDAME